MLLAVVRLLPRWYVRFRRSTVAQRPGRGRDPARRRLPRARWQRWRRPACRVRRLRVRAAGARAGREARHQGAATTSSPRRPTPLELLEKLTRGDVTQAEVRLIEGWTFGQFRAALDASPDLRHDTAGLEDTQILARAAGDRAASGGPVLSRHLPFRHGLERPRGAAPRLPRACSATSRRNGRRATSRAALPDALRGADHGVDHREGNRPGRASAT